MAMSGSIVGGKAWAGSYWHTVRINWSASNNGNRTANITGILYWNDANFSWGYFTTRSVNIAGASNSASASTYYTKGKELIRVTAYNIPYDPLGNLSFSMSGSGNSDGANASVSGSASLDNISVNTTVQNAVVNNITRTSAYLYMKSAQYINTIDSDLDIYLRDRTTLIKQSPDIRYIQIQSTGSTSNTGNHIIECKAFGNGTNIAAGKSVTNNGVSGYIDVNRPFSRVTDNAINIDNYAELGEGTSTVVIDLGAVYPLSVVELWRYYGDRRTYYQTSIKGYNASNNEVAVFHNYTKDGTYPEFPEGLYAPLYEGLYENLTPNTQYSARFRLCSRVSGTWTAATWIDFTTLGNAPVVNTIEAVDITINSARITTNGNVTYDTNSVYSSLEIQYGTTTSYGTTITVSTITGLTPETLYYYRYRVKDNWDRWSEYVTGVFKTLADKFTYIITEDGSVKADVYIITTEGKTKITKPMVKIIE